MSIRPLSRAYNSHRSGNSRPARPAQLSDSAVGNMGDGSLDPQKIVEMSHSTAEALLYRVRTSQDPVIVQRVITLVENEGVEIIAELWESADPTSLPGILWRLYSLRLWMRKNPDLLSRLWRLGEPQETVASAVAGIDEAPTPENIMRTADSILSGAFVGDFAVALDRASIFLQVIDRGIQDIISHWKNEKSYADDRHQAYLQKKIDSAVSMSTKLRITEDTFKVGATKWRAHELS